MKRTKYTLVGILILLLALTFFRSYPDPSTIQRGDPESRVLKLIGRPDQIDFSPPYILWGKDPVVRHINSGECIREFTYNASRRSGGESWHIGFDAHSNVISNFRLTSSTHPIFTSK